MEVLNCRAIEMLVETDRVNTLLYLRVMDTITEEAGWRWEAGKEKGWENYMRRDRGMHGGMYM